jgi:pimeloyl-ACP methyl ester carboxylesterase
VKPVLLLLGGTLNDRSVWDEVAAPLRPHADVRIAVPVQETIAAMTQAAWALLADLPREAGVVLAGFSLGGFVAIEMLARRMRPLRAAALISTSARPDSPEGSAVRARTIAAMQRDFAKAVDHIVQFGTHQASPELAARLRAMMLGVGAEVGIRQNRAVAARADHRAALPRLDLPVRVLCGLQDRVTPADLSRELADLVPGAQLELVDRSGHMLPCERPDAVVGALRELLDCVPYPREGGKPCPSSSVHS